MRLGALLAALVAAAAAGAARAAPPQPGGTAALVEAGAGATSTCPRGPVDKAKMVPAGRDIIITAEGIKLNCYWDSHASTPGWTVGIGHYCFAGRDDWACRGCRAKGKAFAIARAQAFTLLDADMSDAARCLERIVKVPLSNNEYSALMSFTYNFGCSKTKSFAIVSKVLNEDKAYGKVPEELAKFVYGTKKGRDGRKRKVKLGGLVTRRGAEADLWISSDCSGASDGGGGGSAASSSSGPPTDEERAEAEQARNPLDEQRTPVTVGGDITRMPGNVPGLGALVDGAKLDEIVKSPEGAVASAVSALRGAAAGPAAEAHKRLQQFQSEVMGAAGHLQQQMQLGASALESQLGSVAPQLRDKVQLMASSTRHFAEQFQRDAPGVDGVLQLRPPQFGPLDQEG